jgi:glycosyltransferase involved in cell wall biosynthesis
MDNVDVSIAICSHNRPDGLRDCLRSLINQDTGGKFTYEIVVVHTASPGTAEVIEEARQAARVPVRGIHQPHRGAVVARNRSLAESRGEWIALFDDDQTAEPYWLKELWILAHEKNVLSVGGALDLRLPEGCDRRFPPVCRRMLGETVAWDTPRPYTRREGPGCGNQMLHRSVFEAVGVFDDSFSLRGHDTDLYRRIRMAGIESWFTPKALGHHVIPPRRLEDAFFQETSLHTGWSFARRDQLECGAGFALGMAAARVGQALLVNAPRLAAALLGGDHEKILAARIRLWRAEGYVRSTLYMLAPRCFQQRRFFARFEFRADKRLPVPA